MKRKKVLICAQNLNCGGTEIALVNLLNHINLEIYDVTLLLEVDEGIYFDRIPIDVKVKTLFEKNDLIHQLLLEKMNRMHSFTLAVVDLALRVAQKFRKDRMLRYDIACRVAKWTDEEYDIALDFQGYGFLMTAFVADRAKAKTKAIWIHDENIAWAHLVMPYFFKYDLYFGVSQACVDILKTEFPQHEFNSKVFPNYLDLERIQLEAEFSAIDSRFVPENSIVTVGRLVYQKGYDMAIDAAKIMKESGLKFNWYFVGGGELELELKEQIRRYGLEKHCIMLGIQQNPYPYIKNAFVYAQTSRHEGFGLAIAEAKVLNKIIVSTDIACVREQLEEGITGLFLPFDAEKFAHTLSDILLHPDKYQHMGENLRSFSENNKNDPFTVFE